MGLGILEDTKLEHVPGTAFLAEVQAQRSIVEGHISGDVDTSALKHDKSGKLVLVPQPSDSPNDPYNWSRLKRELFCVAYLFGCGAVGAVGPLLNPALVQAAAEFNVSISSFNEGINGALLMCLAAGTTILNALAVVIGKRPVYLLSATVCTATCFWGANAHSIASVDAFRAVQGFFMAPFEALVPGSIADVYFVHERGLRTAIFNLGVLGGINVAGPVSGSIYQNYGFAALYYGMGGAFILEGLLVFFFMPETAYHRANIYNFDTSSHDDLQTMTEKVKQRNAEIASGVVDTGASEPKWSYARQLLPWSGYLSKQNVFYDMVRPYKLLASPIVLWAGIMWINCLTWSLAIAVTTSQIFSAPPYNMTVSQVGAINMAGFVGSLIGTFLSQWLSDYIATSFARRNNGIYEPEFRLIIIIPYLVLSVSGLCAFGASITFQEPWPVPVILGFGMFTLGTQLGATGVVTYINDCYRDRAPEALAGPVAMKNIFTFGLTFYINNWLAESGSLNTFGAIAGILTATAALTIPMYIYGKRVRSWVHRHGV